MNDDLTITKYLDCVPGMRSSFIPSNRLVGLIDTLLVERAQMVKDLRQAYPDRWMVNGVERTLGTDGEGRYVIEG